MAFYTNPGWSNLTPPPVSEQNLNDMSNALEKAAYIENGKLYDNNNNLADIGNAKITLGSYVGSGTEQFSIELPENSILFCMISNVSGDKIEVSAPSTRTGYNSGSYSVSYHQGFIINVHMLTEGAGDLDVKKGSSLGHLYFTINGNTLEILVSLSGGGFGPYYNYSGVTYHYVTIGV